MEPQTPLESEVSQIMVETLNLKMDHKDIDPVAPLFGDGLGLDSIDALEMALVISQKYGYKLRSDDPENVKIFACLRSLCEAIEKNRLH
jgi:acyl carrier protein